MTAPLIGVLALQGDFAAHEAHLGRLGAETRLVRDRADLEQIDGLVMPGGESSTMLRLMHYDQMIPALKAFASIKPVFGTCAGAILMAREVLHPRQESLDLIDIEIERNGYGRQKDSAIARVEVEPSFAERSSGEAIETVLIRAPVIRAYGPDVTVLIRHQGTPLLIEQGRHMAATFHPELTADTRVHALFLAKVAAA